MKKLILFLSIILVAFSSCKKDEPKAFKLDPNATINLKPDLRGWNTPAKVASVDGTESTAPKHLSPMEIVKQTISMSYRNDIIAVGQEILRGFPPEQRDTLSNPPMLKMWATDIISQEGIYVREFINAQDVILIRELDPVKETRDTIAYIPQEVLEKARVKIKSAYDNKDYEEVYKLFNDAFTFMPVTGAEWRALKAKNKN